jgi:hypothetical protein
VELSSVLFGYWRNGGMVIEWRNGGMAEWREWRYSRKNGRIAE